MALTPVVEDQLWGIYKPFPKHRCTSGSFSHPAKMSWSLCAWIMQHLRDEGWAHPGAVICDPMAGIGTTLLLAADSGFHAWGVELESHFFAEAQANIALNRHVWERLGKPIPRVVQGDARNLLALVQGAGVVVRSPPYADQGVPDARHLHFDARRREASIAVKQRDGVPDGYSPPSAIISSPPYADGCAHTGGDDAHPELIQGGHTGHVLQSYSEPVAIVTSPPFGGVTASDYHLNSNPERLQKMYATYKAHGGGMTEATFHRHCEARQSGYSQHPTSGQLGNLPMGDVQAVISSPPYAEGLSKESTYRDQQRRKAGTRRNIMREKGIADAWYGEADGQIGKLRTGDLAAIVTSPPFERSTQVNNTPGDMTEGKARWTGGKDSAARVKQDYTEMASAGNLAHNAGETYWKAMASIYAQCYQLLPVGGHIVLTLKGFIRKRQYVDLPGQTAQLLEHLGFRVLHMHRAMLTSQVAQLTLDGGEDRKSRKSFFRRLSEAKGAPAIDWETVLCAVKEPSHA